MSIEELQQTQARAVDGFQTGEMDQALGVAVQDIQVGAPQKNNNN